MKNSDIQVQNVRIQFEEIPLRVPLKFGAVVSTAVTGVLVEIDVVRRDGKAATGIGSMLLSDVWAWPDAKFSHEHKDAMMRKCCDALRSTLHAPGVFAHPLDLYLEFRPELRTIGGEMPFLATLVCYSPFDMAIHDAFGKVNGICSYDGYGPDYCEHDLGHYLGADFRGKFLSDFLSKSYAAKTPIWHLVGGLDKLTKEEITDADPRDGLPVSLDQWIERDGVFCFKVKTRGNDLAWDVDRLLSVHRVARETLRRSNTSILRSRASAEDGQALGPLLSFDSNEQCPNPQYVLELLAKLRERSREAYDALLYIEQPTERDLSAHKFDQREVARQKPVLADEGIVDLDTFELAKSLGWSGVALKVCKGFSSALLYMAKAKAEGLTFSVQDLTLPGVALVHSAGFAARINPIKGVEYNSRQFIPQANAKTSGRLPHVFEVKAGQIATGTIGSAGLGI